MLEISKLNVSYGKRKIIRDLDLRLDKGKILSIVGESGTGKTTLAYSIMGLIKERSENGTIQGEIFLDGKDINKMGKEELRKIRWSKLSLVFQNVEDALNPVYTILDQVKEPLQEKKSEEKALYMLEKVGFPVHRAKAYPHQLSMGEKQKALIAMAFVCDPELIILDEPTSAMDVMSKESVIKLLKTLCKDKTALLITHDLSTAASLSDNMAILYGGCIVELSPTSLLLSEPRHPYSRGLIRSYPDMYRTKDLQGIRGRPEFIESGCPFHTRCTQSINICRDKRPRLNVSNQPDRYIACHRGGIVPLLEVKGLIKSFGNFKVLDSVDLTLFEGETLTLVGESGAGKTTLAKTIMGLLEITAGQIYLDGEEMKGNGFHRRIQMIFQNPRESISHRMNIFHAVEEPLKIQDIGSKDERLKAVKKVLSEVQLPTDEEFLERYPHELSGGEAQRVVIARALILNPKLIIADEPTSSLDASVQAKIMKLLNNIQEERGLSVLFITHNIALARKISDRIAVMQSGKIVKRGSSSKIFNLGILKNL
ncbi:ATP-binding cassette domain-containing protein [Candidatus Poribacteria bacterium]|nr:ATP-binding cassette domain-containing protein [Candidatus Poribacteria bacterium]